MFNSRSSISISTFLSSLIGSIMRGRRSVRCGQTCEYRKARLILTHDPGEELFLGALHPAAALFREHIDIPELIAEHATYRKVLEEAGARVLTVRQILLDGTGADGKPADRTKLYEGENETYIEASVENSSSILYDKEIRNKPRTRRTKRNV